MHGKGQSEGVGIPRTAYLIPGRGACGVVSVGMFVVVSVSVVSVSVSVVAPTFKYIQITQEFRGKNRNFTPLIIFCHLAGALTPTSILIFIALFDCALQKWVYIDQMQVL